MRVRLPPRAKNRSRVSGSTTPWPVTLGLAHVARRRANTQPAQLPEKLRRRVRHAPGERLAKSLNRNNLQRFSRPRNRQQNPQRHFWVFRSIMRVWESVFPHPCGSPSSTLGGPIEMPMRWLILRNHITRRDITEINSHRASDTQLEITEGKPRFFAATTTQVSSSHTAESVYVPHPSGKG